MNRTLRTSLRIVITAGFMGSALANAQTREFELDIPRQPVAQTLRDLSMQTGLQVAVITRDHGDDGSISGPLRGNYTVDAALDQLLAGSGLSFKRINEVTVAVTDSERAPRAAAPVQERDELIDEVIVTGTNIRGQAPVGAEVRVYNREEIDRSGTGSLTQFARTMTENFANTDLITPRNASFGVGNIGATTNSFSGAAFNIRGVGAGATLTLLNGHRLAPSGDDGTFADISLIPLSVIDRVEVLSNGASAIYGADAVAGVVNLITRKSFDGAETSARYAEASDGGAVQLTASQLLGTSWDSGSVFANYEFDRQGGLDQSQRDYIFRVPGKSDLIPSGHRSSVFVSATQELGPRTSISGDLIYSEREYDVHNYAPSDFSIADTDSTGTVRQSGLNISLQHELSADWRAALNGGFTENRGEDRSTADALDPATQTTLFRTGSASDLKTRILSADLLVNGKLFDMGPGAVRTALGASFRKEKFDLVQLSTFDDLLLASSVFPGLSRDVTSVFAEVVVPLIGRGQGSSPSPRLELSLADRYDDYSDFGSTNNYQGGLVWRPVDALSIRGSYGTSFRAPTLRTLGTPPVYNTLNAFDPNSPTTRTPTLFIQLGNPDLEPETSTTYTVGFDVKILSELTLSATYFDIRYEDRIGVPPTSTGIVSLTDPLLAPYLTRNPALADVQAYFDSPLFAGDFARQGAAGVRAILDRRDQNIASNDQTGVDLSVRYAFTMAESSWAAQLSAQRLLKNEYQTVETLPAITMLNTFNRPPEWRARGGLTWSRDSVSATLNINYVNAYDNPLFTPSHRIDAWTTGDVFVSYSATAPGSMLDGLRIALGVTNLTNERPPHVEIPAELVVNPGEQQIPYDAANASPVGRLISLQLTKSW